MSHSYDYIPCFLPFFDIPVSLDNFIIPHDGLRQNLRLNDYSPSPAEKEILSSPEALTYLTGS